MKKIKLIVASNPESPLIKTFLDSIKDDWDIQLIKQGVPTDINSNEFHKTIRNQYKQGVDYIRNNPGELLILSDIDIQFFRKATLTILECMGDKDIMWLSQRFPWDGKINAGFIVIRCNEKTLKFFNEVLTLGWAKNTGDQGCIQKLLEDKFIDNFIPDLKYGILPIQFWLKRYSNGIPPKDIIMHHAVQEAGDAGTKQESRLKLKLDQLTEIKALVGGK